MESKKEMEPIKDKKEVKHEALRKQIRLDIAKKVCNAAYPITLADKIPFGYEGEPIHSDWPETFSYKAYCTDFINIAAKPGAIRWICDEYREYDGGSQVAEKSNLDDMFCWCMHLKRTKYSDEGNHCEIYGKNSQFCRLHSFS